MSDFWLKLLLALLIAIALLIGLSSQNWLDALFPAPITNHQSADTFNHHCMGDAPPLDYPLSGLLVSLGESGPPTTSVSIMPPPAPALPTAVQPDADNTQNPWIMQQSPSRYTLQIAGGRNHAALVAIAHNHLNQTPHAIYQRTLDDKPWYSLIVGSYPSSSAAQRAMQELPQGLRAKRAWPKSFGEIHQQMQHQPVRLE